MNLRRLFGPFLIMATVFSLLASCGGAGGIGLAAILPGGGGIGGSGATASGSINGFGSIFVNGVEYDTAQADIQVNGQSATESDLGLGMVVLVSGTVNADGVTGTADSVAFDGNVRGPVESIQLSQDGDTQQLSILGSSVIVERIGTVFENTSFDTLAVGDVIEVSGYPESNGKLRATRIEKIEDFVPGVSEIEKTGTVSALVGNQFTLGGFTVDFATAELTGLPGGVIAEGLLVEVHGTLQGTIITASRVEAEDDIQSAFATDEDVSVQGSISAFVDASSFTVNGVSLDASAATFSPADLQLANGQVIEAQGTWDGSVLHAASIEARGGIVKIEGAAIEVSTADKTLTLQLAAGNVVLQLDNKTLLHDDTGVAKPMVLADIGIGDFLEVEAIPTGGALIASSVERDTADDDRLQAPVDSFESGSSVTLLGLTYSVQGAQFRDQNEAVLTLQQFFNIIQPGMLVKLRDYQPADGVADRVEFEFENPLDSETEFDEKPGSDSGSDGSDSGSDDSDSDPGDG